MKYECKKKRAGRYTSVRGTERKNSLRGGVGVRKSFNIFRSKVFHLK